MKTGGKAVLATCFQGGFLLRLLFEPEDGSDMFLRNVGRLATDYAASYPRRSYSSLRKMSRNMGRSYPVTVIMG
jgi:hypothetical protein